jgi:hypothetical protein
MFTKQQLETIAEVLEIALADDNFIDTTSGGGCSPLEAARLRDEMRETQQEAFSQLGELPSPGEAFAALKTFIDEEYDAGSMTGVEYDMLIDALNVLRPPGQPEISSSEADYRAEISHGLNKGPDGFAANH